MKNLKRMNKIYHAGYPVLLLMAFMLNVAIPPVDTFAQIENKYLVSVDELGVVSSGLIAAGLTAAGVYDPGKTINDVSIYKITYHTINVFGDPTIASGAMYVPQTGADSIPLILYQHGTVMKKSQVPSERAEDPPGLFYSGYGYIVAMSDYLGLGDNPGQHPYLHWESEATASIDLLRAAREFLNDSLGISDDQLFLAGYSQGGHATMAVHKYIQVNNLQSEFRIVASAPMSGPYSLSYAQFDHIFSQDSTYTGSYFIPYIISSYQYVYGNLYSDPEEYYDPPYDSIFTAWEASGNFFDNYPIESFPKNIYDFMQDSVVDQILQDPNHPLRLDLRENDLYNWAPQEPVRMIYCGMDMTVAAANATSTQDSMLLLGAPDVLAVNVVPEYNHTTCAIPAFLYAFDWFDSFLINHSVNTSDVPAGPVVSIYPNPVNTLLTVETGIPGTYLVEIHSVNGQLVYSRNLEDDVQRIDFSSFRKGVYLITIRSKDFIATRRVIKL